MSSPNDKYVSFVRLIDRAHAGSRGSSDDERFKFDVGDIVRVVISLEGDELPRGTVAKVLMRRNAYPPPLFEGCWCPLYMLEPIEDLANWGETGESCLERLDE